MTTDFSKSIKVRPTLSLSDLYSISIALHTVPELDEDLIFRINKLIAVTELSYGLPPTVNTSASTNPNPKPVIITANKEPKDTSLSTSDKLKQMMVQLNKEDI